MDDLKLSANNPQFSLPARPLPLDGLRIAVAAADARDWEMVLEAAGAEITPGLRANPSFVLCSATHHSTESFEVCKTASQLGIHLVSFGWLFECLTMQKGVRKPQRHHLLKVGWDTNCHSKEKPKPEMFAIAQTQ